MSRQESAITMFKFKSKRREVCKLPTIPEETSSCYTELLPTEIKVARSMSQIIKKKTWENNQLKWKLLYQEVASNYILPRNKSHR